MPRRPVILALLAVFGVLLSLTGAGAAGACPAPAGVAAAVAPAPMADAGHACCHQADSQAPQDGDPQNHQQDCASKCLMQCCRAMVPVEITLDLIGQAPVVASAPALAAVAENLTSPEPIFHPPKV